jgi:hypothetical protein
MVAAGGHTLLINTSCHARTKTGKKQSLARIADWKVGIEERSKPRLARDVSSGCKFENEAKKTKSSELSFAAPWLVPSPRYFAKIVRQNQTAITD